MDLARIEELALLLRRPRPAPSRHARAGDGAPLGVAHVAANGTVARQTDLVHGRKRSRERDDRGAHSRGKSRAVFQGIELESRAGSLADTSADVDVAAAERAPASAPAVADVVAAALHG